VLDAHRQRNVSLPSTSHGVELMLGMSSPLRRRVWVMQGSLVATCATIGIGPVPEVATTSGGGSGVMVGSATESEHV